MLTARDIAQARYEQIRTAANDDRPQVLRATLTVNLQGDIYTFPAFGTSIEALSQTAEELAGDDPFGYSVIVHESVQVPQ